MVNDLTVQQELFSQEIAKGNNNQSACYRIAYPSSLSWKDSTVHSKASILMTNGKVMARIAGLQATVEKHVLYTMEEHYKELEECRQLAITKEDISNTIKATELKGKATGKYKEQIGIDMTVKQIIVNVVVGGKK